MSIGFFTDAALTQEVTSPLVATQNSDGSTAPVVFHLWLGDISVGFTYQANSNPGVDNIEIQCTDTTPGSGHETTELKLATTNGGLSSAVAGDPLIVGLSLASEPAGAFEFFLQVDDATGTVGTVTELGLQTNVLRKS